MSSNENRRDLDKVAIDKGIRPVEISAKNDMPAGILSMTPLGRPPLTTQRHLGPQVQGQPGNQPTPGATGISPNVAAAPASLSDDKAQRVRDVASRKR
ncbi:MAG: hypothetical protein ACLQJ0_26275 [Steroidobacteraceae bacterium]|jgi:hypothetical protein